MKTHVFDLFYVYIIFSFFIISLFSIDSILCYET